MTLRFRHATLLRGLNLAAVPEPCQDGHVFYRWAPPNERPQIPPQLRLQDILIDDGDSMIVIHPLHHRCDPVGGAFELPEHSQVLNARRSRRYRCASTRVELIQNSARFKGELIDFSATSLLVRLNPVPPQSFSWIQPEMPVHLILADDQDVSFAAQCRILRTRWGIETGTCVLEPSDDQVQRFKPKRHRSRRLNPQPPPNLIFVHPLTGRRVEMTVVELSGNGLGVETHPCEDTLVPGLVIRNARLVFAGGASFDCRLQAIHSHSVFDGNGEVVRSGFAILDIPPEQHTRLLTLLYQVDEPNAYINHTQDMDALWRFFFDTGFIYPEKYVHLHPRKALIQSTFKKLYTAHPSFARHFTYQRMGRVMAHMSMLKFYSRAWMIQHHAAKTAESHRAGLIVMDQIGRFINDSHRFYRAQMNHVFCIYRPENKFPSRVFGGAADSMADVQACSRDTFAYLHLPATPPPKAATAGHDWHLAPCQAEDLAELAAYYAEQSGGLMLQAFDLTPEGHDIRILSQEYRAIGFRRDRRLFTLRRKGYPVAFIMANRSDLGLNMSDLTNNIQVFVIEPSHIPADIMYRALTRIIAWYPDGAVPIMIYPEIAASGMGMPGEKRYTVWVLNLEHTDRYFDFISRLIQITTRRRAPAAVTGGGAGDSDRKQA